MTIPHSISKRNKALMLAAVAVIAVSTGGITYFNTNHSSTKSAVKPQETKVESKTQPKATESVSNVPEVQDTDNIASSDQTATQTTQSAPTQQATTSSIPSIDELKAQYGWNNEMSTAIETYVRLYPDYFSDDHRVMTFKYMYDVAVAATKMRNLDVTPYSTYYQFTTLHRQYGWAQCGIMVGIDWNSYIN